MTKSRHLENSIINKNYCLIPCFLSWHLLEQVIIPSCPFSITFLLSYHSSYFQDEEPQFYLLSCKMNAFPCCQSFLFLYSFSNNSMFFSGIELVELSALFSMWEEHIQRHKDIFCSVLTPNNSQHFYLSFWKVLSTTHSGFKIYFQSESN